MKYSLNKLYEAIGISRQAVWEHQRREQAEGERVRKLIHRADREREAHPGCGLEKLYWKLGPEGMGRDKFCAVFTDLGYGLKKPRKPWRTTFSVRTLFGNLIRGRVLTGPNQVWAGDTTYIRIGDRFYYLTFITDVYTRQIIGWAASASLRAEANLRALRRALAEGGEADLRGLIHHSDRGSQYHSSEYLSLLRAHGIQVSMGGKATENAYAERVNGIIKAEYLYPWGPTSFSRLKAQARRAVTHYNRERLHWSLGLQTPQAYRKKWDHLAHGQRPVQVIRTPESPNFVEASLHKAAQTAQGPVCAMPN